MISSQHRTFATRHQNVTLWCDILKEATDSAPTLHSGGKYDKLRTIDPIAILVSGSVRSFSKVHIAALLCFNSDSQPYHAGILLRTKHFYLIIQWKRDVTESVMVYKNIYVRK